MVSEIDQIAHTRLRRDGQRYTDNRRQLERVLAETADPLTIPEILRQRADLAQSSVYRNLSILERAGVVQKIVTTDEWARFELAEDLTEHHHHLICSVCGDVTDFTVPPAIEHDLEAALARVAKRARFEVRHHRLDLVGTCPRCT